MAIEAFNNTINKWIDVVECHDFDSLCASPSAGSWSLGQVCVHLLRETHFHIGNIRRCIATHRNAGKKATPAGRAMLSLDEFPDEIIEGPPSNSTVAQPVTKEQLLRDLVRVKEEMNTAAAQMLKSPCHGKIKHPGLGYFSAAEWLQLSDMHLRHHFRQKDRIEKFLNGR